MNYSRIEAEIARQTQADREQLSQAYLSAYRQLCDCIADKYHQRQQADVLTERVLKAWDNLHAFEDKNGLNEQR